MTPSGSLWCLLCEVQPPLQNKRAPQLESFTAACCRRVNEGEAAHCDHYYVVCPTLSHLN